MFLAHLTPFPLVSVQLSPKFLCISTRLLKVCLILTCYKEEIIKNKLSEMLIYYQYYLKVSFNAKS